MQAIHGGTAKNDTIDSPTIAALLRGGMLPQAYVSPAQMRATRDLLRRRRPLTHQRAALLAHMQHTTSQSTLPAIGNKIADKAHRDGVAARCADAAGHKSIAVELALLTSDDALLRDGELRSGTTARHHDAHTLSLLQTVPGIGTLLSLVLLYAIHDIARFPRVQDVVSYGRLVKGRKESAGTRSGTSGTTIGQAPLTWALSEAAVWFLSDHAAAQTYLARLEHTHGKANALTVLAQQRARAVSYMLKRPVAFATETCFQREPRREGSG
jgi:transposase